MAFEQLTDRLQETFRGLSGKAKLSEKNIQDALRDIRMSLLEADVNLEVIQSLLTEIEKEAIGMKVAKNISPDQMFVKIVNDELVKVLGEDYQGLEFTKKPGVLMMVGLQGSGKTTSLAKIAYYLKNKENKRVLLVAADLARPAAIEQLQILGEDIGVEVFSEQGSDVVSLGKNALQYAKKNSFDVVLVDTAGRLQIDEALMNELQELNKVIKAEEILLSVDAMSGQDIINVAEGFKSNLELTGLMATKFDGDARGGAVLSVRHLTQVPVKFVGVGEKPEDLELFYPDRIASRILGMGDIVTLVEKAQEKMDIEASEKAAERLLEGKFTLDDMLLQLQQVSKMGPLSGLMKMIPGMNQMVKQVDDIEAESSMKMTEAIILSMTPYERANPDKIRASHKRRIAMGSGTTTTDVNRLINQFNKMQKQMKMLSRFMK